MSTRQLRPRTPRITDAFNTSKLLADTPKLAIKKKGGPQKFATATNIKRLPNETINAPEHSTSISSPSTASQNEWMRESSKSSAKLIAPPAEDEPSEYDPNVSELSSPLSLSSGASSPPLKKKPKPKPKAKKASTKSSAQKKNKLKYPPGTTPYSELEHPTLSECIEVVALLTTAHGSAVRPESVPNPDNSVSGCGEVPSVLDALARTVLSANTTNANSSRAFKGLLDEFGMIPHDPDEGIKGTDTVKTHGAKTQIIMARKIGQGSVDWDNVRRAPIKAVVGAIKSGGLAVIKAKHIKNILDIAWEEGQELKRVKMEGEVKIEVGDMEKVVRNQEDEDGELSLEHLRDMGDDEVMAKLMSFDGVGCKTASCVAMFCLGRPKFPVDTHVWRISKYLSWIPENATREDAYHHLDTRIPNDLKYSLHNLLIRHGRTCRHCKAGPEPATTPTKKPPTKRPRGNEEEGGNLSGESPGKKVKTKKVWVGTGMMKEVVVEVPDDGIEQGPGEESLEACVLEQLIARRARKFKKA